MKILSGGSRHLEALPGVRRAAVQQFCPGYVVLAWNADLPVTVDHKLRAAILEGWRRGGRSARSMSETMKIYVSRGVGGKPCCQEEKYSSWLQMAAVCPQELERDYPWPEMETSTFTCRGPMLGKSSLQASLIWTTAGARLTTALFWPQKQGWE